MFTETKNRVTFAVGTGRCGTHLLYTLMSREKDVASSHERNRFNEAFHRYCVWYGLNVDHEGFLRCKEEEIRRDLAEERYSFESSAILSLSIRHLYDRFGSRFLLLVRKPEAVVASYWRKGWYKEDTLRSDSSKAIGYQPTREPHHFLGRIVPTGDEFERWNALTRIGKLSWFWNVLNERVCAQFEVLPDSNWRMERIEDFGYEKYIDVCEFVKGECSLSRRRYDRITSSRPGKKPKVYTIESWTDREKAEFEAEVSVMAKKFGYR